MQEDLQTKKDLAKVLLQQMPTGQSQGKASSMKKRPQSVRIEPKRDLQELLERVFRQQYEKTIRDIEEYLRRNPDAA